jgi:hypothetical protein
MPLIPPPIRTPLTTDKAGNIFLTTIRPWFDWLRQLISHPVVTSDVDAEAITAEKIKANTITAAKIAAHTITATEIASHTITADEIASHTITAAEIKALTITAAEIAATTITGDRLVANIEISSPVITGGKLQTDAGDTVGIKIDSTSLRGYAAGSQVFCLTTAGAFTVAGGTITGGILQTHEAADTGIKINSTGLLVYNASNELVFKISVAGVVQGFSGGDEKFSYVDGITKCHDLYASDGTDWIRILPASLGLYDGGTAKILLSQTSLKIIGVPLIYDNDQVVGARITGWVAPTGDASRATFATSTVTLEELAKRVKALIDDVTTHGLIGPTP